MSDTNHDLRLALERIVFGRTPHTMRLRLKRHDELVERMARALVEESAKMYGRLEWDVLSPAGQDIWRAKATAALDALLTAVVKLDVGGLVPIVKSINPERYGKQLVIELEEKQHGE